MLNIKGRINQEVIILKIGKVKANKWGKGLVRFV